MHARSLLLDQAWSDKDSYAREDWFFQHSDTLARSRGAVINALRDHAAVIAATKAHELHVFDCDEWVNDKIDRIDAGLAPEVAAWFAS